MSDIIFIIIIALLASYIIRLKLHQATQDHVFPFPERLGLHVSNNDVMHFLNMSSENVKSFLERRGIDFMIKCEPESMMGWIDTELLDKILLLLLSDMAKRLNHGGKVAVAVYTNQEYDCINIRISDNGPRISETGMLIIHYLVTCHRGSLRSEYYHIELHVPTIDIPSNYEEGNSSLWEIMQAPHSADQEFLRRAIQCVNDHLSDTDYDRQAFATDMGSSVSTLYNKIRALTGKNITNFTRDIRIKAACKLAKEDPDLRVSDIAYQVGFKDPKYFATSFKRVMGVQPKEYFAKLRGEG